MYQVQSFSFQSIVVRIPTRISFSRSLFVFVLILVLVLVVTFCLLAWWSLSLSEMRKAIALLESRKKRPTLTLVVSELAMENAIAMVIAVLALGW